MRINFLTQGINFGETIISTTAVKKTDGSKAELNFVEYDCDNKKDCAKIKDTQKLWGPEAVNMDLISGPFNHSGKIHTSVPWRHFYGPENKSGDILVIAKTRDSKVNMDDKTSKIIDISNIQANPDEMWDSTHKKYRNLGELLVCQIVKIAKKDDAEAISLKSENEGFWSKSGLFKLSKNSVSARPTRSLAQTNYDDYIDYIENKK